MQRIKSSNPIIDMTWTFGDANVEDSRWVSPVAASVHAASMRCVHSAKAGDHEQIAAAAGYMVVFLRDAIRHYGRRYLVGGDLHLPTMSAATRTLLEESQAIALNDLVESLFGIVDQHVTTTSTKSSVLSIQTHVQSATNRHQVWWDSLTDEEKDAERENAVRKAPLLKARAKHVAEAAKTSRREWRKAKATAGEGKEGRRVEKIGRIQTKNLSRFRTVEELEEEHAKKSGVVEKRQLVHDELEVYKEFYKDVQVVTQGGETTTLGQARDDDDLPFWQKTLKSKNRPDHVRYANLRYLIRWMSDSVDVRHRQG
jgi:hypothetical protein